MHEKYSTRIPFGLYCERAEIHLFARRFFDVTACVFAPTGSHNRSVGGTLTGCEWCYASFPGVPRVRFTPGYLIYPRWGKDTNVKIRHFVAVYSIVIQ